MRIQKVKIDKVPEPEITLKTLAGWRKTISAYPDNSQQKIMETERIEVLERKIRDRH